MLDRLLRKAEQALEEGRPHRAIEYLKRGIRRDHYWETGHRLLGEIYLIILDHPAYALVQYRKLNRVKETPSFGERVGLAWAYYKRDFEDRAHEIIENLPEEKPESVQFLETSFETETLLDEIGNEVSKSVEERQDEYHQKHLEQGRDYLKLGDWFHAQKALERALEIKETPEARLAYGRCLLKRKRYPGAVKMFKSVRNHEELGNRANELLNEVYGRLGIESGNDRDETSGEDSIQQVAS